MATRKIGFYELMKAIYTRLTTDPLTSGYTVYNHVPDDADFPFISYGQPYGGRSASFSAQDIAAEDNTVTIDVWSDYEGDKEVAQMMDNICQALDGSVLRPTGYTQLTGLLDYTDIIIDETEPAKILRHGIIRFRYNMA